jgi:hypothetical protein
MTSGAFTQKRVESLVRSAPGRYCDCGDKAVRGLMLVVVSGRKQDHEKLTNNASWQLRYQIGEREHWLGLGSAREFQAGGSP